MPAAAKRTTGLSQADDQAAHVAHFTAAFYNNEYNVKNMTPNTLLRGQFLVGNDPGQKHTENRHPILLRNRHRGYKYELRQRFWHLDDSEVIRASKPA